MSGYTPQDMRHFAARITGLHEYTDWLRRDPTTPISAHLADIVTVDSAQRLAEYAAVREMEGPHQARDGSWYLHRAFAGGMSWQAICRANHADAGPAEQQAREWAVRNGFVLVPLADATREM